MAKRKAKFRVMGMFEMACRPQEATVSIDRDTGVVEIRPLRRRKIYLTTLAAMASVAVRREIQREVQEKKKAKKTKKKFLR